MAKYGKHYRNVRSKVENKVYELGDAIALIKSNPFAKFDETVDVAFRLGVDFKKSDQTVRGTVTLPHGSGKHVRVIVFANGADADAAREASADEVGYEDLVARIQGGWMDFDVAIATKDAMKEVRKLGKFLGPRGLMPSPKAGTVTDDVRSAVNQFKAGRVEFRMDRHGNVMVPFGKLSFDTTNLAENARAVIDAVIAARPPATKGIFIKRCSVSSTMGIGLQIVCA